METEIIKQETSLQATTPDQLLAMAVDKDLDIDKLEKLMLMKERWDAAQAKKAFLSALTHFQDQCPDIRKNKKVAFDTRVGKTEYNFAPLGDIDRQIKKLMKECGLSKQWRIREDAGKIKVICVLSHVDGHSEETEMEAEADLSGGKNAIQGKGSAIQYMKRYTLEGALGLTTSEQDVDGNMPEIDIDILHKQYMVYYSQLIQIDSKFSKWAPENWKAQPTPKVYASAIHEIKKKLAELTPPEV